MNTKEKRINDFMKNKNIEVYSYKTYKLYNNVSGRKIKIRGVIDDSNYEDESTDFHESLKVLAFVLISIITFTIILERVITPHFILTYSYTTLLIVCFLIAFVCMGAWYLIFKGIGFLFNIRK